MDILIAFACPDTMWKGREGRVDLSTEIPVDNYYVQIIARDDDNYYCLYAKTNNGMITFTESDLVCTQGLHIKYTFSISSA